MKNVSLAFHAIRIVMDENVFGSIANYQIESFDSLLQALANLEKALNTLAPEQRDAFIATYQALIDL